MPNAGAPVLVGDVARWYCKGEQATAQALAASTFTLLNFDGADAVDNLGIHDPVTNNSRFQIGLALGWWLVIGTVAFGAGSGKGIRSRLILNGSTSVNGAYSAQPSYVATAGGFVTVTSTALVQASAAADYVGLQGWTELAASTIVSGDLRPSLTCIYQGP